MAHYALIQWGKRVKNMATEITVFMLKLGTYIEYHAQSHYQGSLLSPWTQKMAVFSVVVIGGVSGGIWTVLIKISADKRSLSQLTVKILVFSLIIKTFCHQHHRMVHEKAINVSVWIKEICTLLWKFHIIFSRMQRVNQHARPSIIQVGCPTCCYQVCALDHARGGVLQTWITTQSIAIVMLYLYEIWLLH